MGRGRANLPRAFQPVPLHGRIDHLHCGDKPVINLELFEPRHLEILNPWSDKSFTGFIAASEKYRECLFRSGPAFSGFMEDGSYLGTVGFIRFPWGTTCDVWMVLDRNIKRCRKDLQRFILDRIDWAFEILKIDRMQAVVEVEDLRARKWIKSFGFHRETEEGGVAGFGPGGVAFHLYARVRNES